MSRVGHDQAIQMVGACGRGKTTRHVGDSTEDARGELRLSSRRRTLPGDPGWISAVDRRSAAFAAGVCDAQIFSSGLPLVLATHCDLERVLRRFGYSVRTIWIGSENTARARFVDCSIAASKRRDWRPVRCRWFRCDKSTQLIERFGSNVRAIEHFLYERVQTQVINQVTRWRSAIYRLSWTEPDALHEGGGTITGVVRVVVDADVKCSGLEVQSVWRTHGRG